MGAKKRFPDRIKIKIKNLKKRKKMTESENNELKESLETIKPIENKVEPQTIRKIEPSEQKSAEELEIEIALLKTKCSYYESALEKVLFFIVPDNCREMVNYALATGKSNFEKY